MVYYLVIMLSRVLFLDSKANLNLNFDQAYEFHNFLRHFYGTAPIKSSFHLFYWRLFVCKCPTEQTTVFYQPMYTLSKAYISVTSSKLISCSFFCQKSLIVAFKKTMRGCVKINKSAIGRYIFIHVPKNLFILKYHFKSRYMLFMNISNNILLFHTFLANFIHNLTFFHSVVFKSKLLCWCKLISIIEEYRPRSADYEEYRTTQLKLRRNSVFR